MTKFISMTRNLSLREFAKRERANLWQSKGKFVFKFVDCHDLPLVNLAMTKRRGYHARLTLCSR